LLGDYLKDHRQGVGLSLNEISSRTKIRLEYLKALEAEEFERMPGDIYVYGYLRDYLNALSVDPSEAVNMYREYRKKAIRNEVSLPKRRGSFHLPSRAIYALLVLVLSVPVIFFFARKDQIQRDGIGVPNHSSINKVVTMIPNPVTPAEADYTNKHLLEIKAIEDTWIFLQIDDNLSYSMLLKPGHERSWTAENKIFLKIGNAGGIKVTFDGKSMGAPGKRGQIVSLTLPEEIDKRL
jgi:hypothetical protein